MSSQLILGLGSLYYSIQLVHRIHSFFIMDNHNDSPNSKQSDSEEVVDKVKAERLERLKKLKEKMTKGILFSIHLRCSEQI